VIATAAQRELGLSLLKGGSDILRIAREVSRVIAQTDLDAAVIGGVAVVLHGHVRTTLDVDVYADDLNAMAVALENTGFVYDTSQKQFSKGGVPVHLVSRVQIGNDQRQIEEIDGVRTVSLSDLITMKLRTGTTDMLGAQDMADVIGLIRHNQLTTAFAPQIAVDVRPKFQELAREIAKRGSI
jgi:hypothetical protein